MRRRIGLAGLLLLAIGLSTGGDGTASCQSIALSGIEWVASINASENPDTPANHAVIVQGTDGFGEYYGMEWNSPEFTDLSLNALDHSDRTGTNAISLKLSATEAMDVVVVVSVRGDYCGDTWRYAASEPIRVGTIAQDFELPSSAFSDNPFGSCTGQLSEDALEDICSIFLLPSPTAGELRIYEVALCGVLPEEVAVEMPVDEPPLDETNRAIPVFTVDSDVTLDSVVQIGNGPQELSTDIKFYPNTRRIEPGDTVYWTLDLGDLEGPFTIVPEMGNDNERETSFRTNESEIVIEAKYSTPNLYVPYVTVQDASSSSIVIYTTNPVVVPPTVVIDTPSILKAQTSEAPTGTYIKGVNAFVIDNDSTHEELRFEISRIKSDGFNMLCVPFFVTTSGNVTLPAYYGPYDNAFYRTPDLATLGAIAQLCAEEGLILGMSPGISPNPFNWEHQNEGIPDDLIDLFFCSYERILVAYASLFSEWGVSLFQIGREFPVLAEQEAKWRDVITAVRRVYPYALTYSADPNYEPYRIGFWDALDYFSIQGYFLPNPGEGIAAESWSEEQLRRWLRLTFQYNIEPLQRQIGIPFLNAEVGFPSPDRGLAEDYQALMFTVLLEESGRNSYQAGNLLWEWGIGPRSDPYLAYGFEGFDGESAIAKQFLKMPNTTTLQLSPTAASPAGICVDGFDGSFSVSAFSETASSIRASIDTHDSYSGSG